MLSFTNTMFLDMLHQDGLLISAKGIGVEEVFFSMIKVYCDPGNLVLVMGLSEDEQSYYRSRLDFSGSQTLPKKVNSEYSSGDREKLYLEGGVLFVTTRILVVDMLTDKIPIHLITGILIARAHRTAESCQEAFVLRMFRQKNRTGFIKAFSSSPISFTTGFCRAERVMRGLFVRNLYLWPRFHNDVVSTIEQCATKPLVVEVQVEMTTDMRTIQSSVLDLINFSMQELRRLNPSLYVANDNDDDGVDEFLTVENAVSKFFYKLLQRELDPVWHRLSWKTKQLVADMKTLHNVLVHLTQYDCVTFHALVSALRTAENAHRSSGWMILDAAEAMFVTANTRVFGSAGETSDDVVKCEENPKWSALTQVLDEIREEVVELNHDDDDDKNPFPSEKVLILCLDERVAVQLHDVVTIGTKGLLARMFNRALGDKHGYLADSQEDETASKRFRHVKDKGVGKKSKPVVVAEKEEVSTSGLTIVTSPVIIIQSMDVGHFSLYKLINEMKPRYAVLYDVDVGVIRQLEVFQAAHQDRQLKTYILMYKNSVEEQAYLTSLRKEKEAFGKLIKDKSTMVVPEDREGRLDHHIDVEQSSSRKQGQSSSAVKKVIVDMREFRSELPSLLHKRGIDIEPVTLEVGDYVLTPEICVERKSISDLVGSLNSGRLYNQATSMTRFYSKPMLLIEFDSNKPFSLQGKYYLSKDVASGDVTARLQLLTLHFPQLRILWSPSPHATAELFEELKQGRQQPDASKAASISTDAFREHNNKDRYNPVAHDLVQKLPGINSKNLYSVLNGVNSMEELLGLSVQDLSEKLGEKGNAELLYSSLHETVGQGGEDCCGGVQMLRKPTTSKKKTGSRFKTGANLRSGKVEIRD